MVVPGGTVVTSEFWVEAIVSCEMSLRCTTARRINPRATQYEASLRRLLGIWRGGQPAYAGFVGVARGFIRRAAERVASVVVSCGRVPLGSRSECR